MAKAAGKVEYTRPQMAFRYVCHGCTKPADYGQEPLVGIAITCPHCGKVQTSVAENWVRMDAQEAQAINGPFNA